MIKTHLEFEIPLPLPLRLEVRLDTSNTRSDGQVLFPRRPAPDRRLQLDGTRFRCLIRATCDVASNVFLLNKEIAFINLKKNT